jgi:hypothetical protein
VIGAKQVRPYTVDDLIEEIAPGHREQMARLDERWEEEDKQRHEWEVRALKRLVSGKSLTMPSGYLPMKSVL